MRISIVLLASTLLFAESAFAGWASGGGGPPPAKSDLDVDTGVLTIEKEIGEILEVSPTEYSKYVLDSALGKPLIIEGRTHTTDLMDMTNGRIVLKPTNPKYKRILLQRMLDMPLNEVTPAP